MAMHAERQRYKGGSSQTQRSPVQKQRARAAAGRPKTVGAQSTTSVDVPAAVLREALRGCITSPSSVIISLRTPT